MSGELCRILFLAVVFFTNVVQVITGFAGTMLAMPVSIRLIGAQEAKAVLNFLGLAASLLVCIRNRKMIVRRECVRMCGGMLVGMLVGTWLFRRLPLDFLLYGYGILILVIAVKKLFFPQKESQKEKNGAASIIILFCAGLIHGMFVSGGALLVIYAAGALREKNAFRATISAVWVVLNTILLVEHIACGAFTDETFLLCGLSLAALFLAAFVGERLGRKISRNAFLKLTYVLLLISGISVLV